MSRVFFLVVSTLSLQHTTVALAPSIYVPRGRQEYRAYRESPRPIGIYSTALLTSSIRRCGRLTVSMTSPDGNCEHGTEKSKMIEQIALGAWVGSMSGFILVNDLVGPWPQSLQQVPERIWFLIHMLGSMIFGGGIILTTAIEWLVVANKKSSVLQFWFDKVPLLDTSIVLPGLTLSVISGTALCVHRYGGLELAPLHIQNVFYTLLAFAAWWASTDLTTQGQAKREIKEWATWSSADKRTTLPKIVELRRISNVVSCVFVVALYSIMVMKPGTIPYQ